MQKIVLLVHGMGDLSEDKFNKRVVRFEKDILKREPSLHDKVLFRGIFYSGILQETQNALFEEMRKEEIDFLNLRRFFLFGFGDAGSLEHRSFEEGSVYEQVQRIIYRTIETAYAQASEDAKVIIVAQSLGCQVISNYIWDSQASAPKQGIWKLDEFRNLNNKKSAQQRLKRLKYLITTGCNIPIFVSGKPKIQGVFRNERGYNFIWHNYYDRDDVLGWPLKPLGKFFDSDSSSEGMSYSDLVSIDEEINADKGFIDRLITSWTPFSHIGYWNDDDLLDKIARTIKSA